MGEVITMGEVSYRKWDIWVNYKFYREPMKLPGYYECMLVPALMVHQTVEFLAEKYEIKLDKIVSIKRASGSAAKMMITSKEGNLCIKIIDTLDTGCNVETIIHEVILTLDSLSICVDAALICNSIRFIGSFDNQIFFAVRRPFNRALAFEVEERIEANNKLTSDFLYYRQAPTELKVAIQHYLTGLTLLGLEDQISGLIDASYVQFCQGCEAVCNCSDGNVSTICRYIARVAPLDHQDLQIIAHHVWQVRNKYYGHGDIRHNLKAISDYNNAYNTIKQVLVARYLCKRLIDLGAPSGKFLVREMRFYPEYGSEMYRGTVEELGKEFRVDYPGRTAKLYDSNGKEVGKYTIP